MKNNFTLPVTKEKQNEAKSSENEKMLSPSKRTLTFLKQFARNYQVEKTLPEGLQEVILG